MCGIAGFFHAQGNYRKKAGWYNQILTGMCDCLNHRGPDERGIYLTDQVGLAHVRLSIIDLKSGRQPMMKQVSGQPVVIIFNGEIYNMNELKMELIKKGHSFSTTSDTEVILNGYLEYGANIVTRLNGIFAFAIWDGRKEQLILFRDRSGVKPLFFMKEKGALIFGSEPKAIFRFPGIHPKLNRQGLNEVFSIGPAKTYGCGVYEDMEEVLPGYYYIFYRDTMKPVKYWKLISEPHEDSYEDTVEKVTELVRQAVVGQMLSDVPICTFLSGGLDSSLVSAICAGELKKKGQSLTTFSFDFEGNQKYFQANDFQPEQDRPWVDRMVEAIDSDHHYLECDNLELIDYLFRSIDARDLPGMADVDASLLYFCSKVKEKCKVALTGECADEIFGGYPWFHKKECFEADTFPWTMDLEPRKALLRDDFIEALGMEDYVSEAYHQSLSEVPKLEGESETEARRREISYLNMKWFMQTLLDRMDRTSMYSGLEARVPFADHRIIEYMWNVPWEMKCKDGMVKHLLRRAGEFYLPKEICYRKKSPYPKTYHPRYEQLLGYRLMEIMENSSAPIHQFLDARKVKRFINAPSDYGRPWYGQLMAGPQMLAYMIQVNYWMEKYHISIHI